MKLEVRRPRKQVKRVRGKGVLALLNFVMAYWRCFIMRDKATPIGFKYEIMSPIIIR